MLRTTLGLMRAPAFAFMALLALMTATPAVWAQGEGDQPNPAAAGNLFRPVAVVNGSAITGFDLTQRAQMLVAMGFPAASPDALRGEALDRLIEDRLKIQEAKQLGLSASPEQLQAGIEDLAENLGVAPDEMLALLSAEGISRQAVEDMVTADVVWSQVVRTRFQRRVDPGEAEIDAEITELRDRASLAYRLAEIGLPLDEDGRSAQETRALAERLSRELAQGGDFAEAVRRYSRAPSAEQGGEVGWVTTAGLPPHIAEALSGLASGDVSPPIEVSGGLSILKVLETRVQSPEAIDTSDPELREQVRSRLANQQGARLAEGLLQELRRDALIEIR